MQWIKLHCQRWFLGSTHFELTAEERAIWIDCLAMAGLNKPEGQINFFSLEQLAQYFCVPVEALKSALDKFTKFKKVIFKNPTTIKINNWHKYQSPQNLTPPKERPKSNIKSSDKPITDFNIKNRDKNRIDKNRIEETPLPPFQTDINSLEFEKAWSLYPSRNGKKLLKAEAKALFLRIKDTDLPSLLMAIQNYATSKGVLDGFAKDMVRFLRNNRWREWLTEEVAPKLIRTEVYPGSVPWQPPEKTQDFKPPNPEVVKQALSEIKEKLYRQRPDPILAPKSDNNKPILVLDTEKNLLLAEKKKSDDRRKLAQLYANDNS